MIELRDIDFLIIGATKSATTWLQRALQSDPVIYMPDPEIHFFSRAFDRGMDWYLSQFSCADRSRVVGEKSNSYLEEPAAAARISEALPHARLIVQLRNPVERAYSDYCMLYRRGEVSRRIDRYLDPQRASDKRFISSGHYSEQLERFFRFFDRDRLLILLYEDVAAKPEEQINRVRAFLDLPKAQFPDALQAKVKDKTAKRMPPRLLPILKPIKPLVEPLRGTAAFTSVASQLRREISYPVLTDALRAKLTAHFAPFTDSLETMIDHDLSIWRERCDNAA